MDVRVWGSRKDEEDRTKQALMSFYGCKSERELIVIADAMGLTLNELVKRVTDRYLKSLKESSSSNLLDFLQMHEPKT